MITHGTMQQACTHPLTLFLLGANPDSTNRGVAALGTACIDNLRLAFPNAHLIVAAGGLNREFKVALSDGDFTVEASWLTGRQSPWQRSAVQHLQWIRRLRTFLPGLATLWLPNQTFEQLQRCDAVLDIGGGDSFADTYTSGTFVAQAAVKLLALQMGKPLVLLPQTFGPFRTAASKRIASSIMARSALVVTRDIGGLADLSGVMAQELDDRFLICPDVAFTLQPGPIPANDLARLTDWDGPVIGLNVSGLLWGSNVDFGLRGNYRELTQNLVDWAMRQTGARLLLVPHVFNNSVAPRSSQADRLPLLSEEPELEISMKIAATAQQQWGKRVVTIDKPYSASQLKSIIGRCDFFIGARMHACIAAVSQALPTVILAYSQKAAGVMGLIGSDGKPPIPVVDLRQPDADEVLAVIDQAYRARSIYQAKLASVMTDVQRQVKHFFGDTLVNTLSKSVPTAAGSVPMSEIA